MNAAIIDIGSGSVALALVELEKNKAPKIKFSRRYDFRMDSDLNLDRIVSQTLTGLTGLILELQNSGFNPPEKIFCFLSSHLIASQTRIIKANFNQPRKIDQLMIDELIKGDLDKFKIDNGGTLGDKNTIIIEKKIMRVRLNGYEVSKFKNKNATAIEISMLLTLTSVKIFDQIKELIIGAFHNKELEAHSFSLALFTVIRDLWEADRDFIFMDIGSEITDICLTRGAALESSTSFPVGKNSLIRSMIDQTNTNQKVVESMLNNYAADPLDSRIRRYVKDNLNQAGRRWMDLIYSAMSKLDGQSKLPADLILLADRDSSAIFEELIGQIKLSNLTILNKEPNLKKLSGDELRKFCENKSGASDDIFLSILSIYVSKLLN